MITYSLLGQMGRLGNQLHQIASTIGIALKNKTDFGFPVWENQDAFKNPLPTVAEFPTQRYLEHCFHYTDIILENPHVDLQGYFQSKKYWAHCEDLVHYYLTPKEALLYSLQENFGHVINNPHSTAIHVRRGDYNKFFEYHTVLSISYYLSAVQEMKDHGVKPYLVCFSDDIQWCKQYLYFVDTFIEGTTKIEDLFLMSKCKNNIIANSSFSWWAATLNNNPDKVVVAPKNWFGPKLPHCTTDLYSDKWIIT